MVGVVRGNAHEIGQTIITAAGIDGDVYIALPNGRDERILRIDRDGNRAAGWPVELTAFGCFDIAVADDGSIRVMCEGQNETDGLQAPFLRIFGLARSGRQMPGWPVDIEGGGVTRVIGSDLHVVAATYPGDAPEMNATPAAIVVVSSEGLVARGREFDLACCAERTAINSDGVVFGMSHEWADTAVTTVVGAFDADGMRSGWPIRFDGNMSEFGFDPGGRAIAWLERWSDHRTRALVFDAHGGLGSVNSPWLSLRATSTWSGAGDVTPGAPAVTSEGRSYLLGGTEGARIDQIGLDGVPIDGWTYRSSRAFAQNGYCGEGDTGCGFLRTAPVVGTSGDIFVAFAAGSSSTGGTLASVGSAGHLNVGWPVTLKRAGAEFWSLTSDPDGGIWALAIEPEGRSASATLLSIADDSTIRWSITLVQP